MPKDAANRDYWANNMATKIDKIDLPYKKPELLEKLQQVKANLVLTKEPKRNKARVCSFFVAGKCNRGKSCPYRHDDITEEDLEAMQKGQGKLEDRIRARYDGENDPLAKKILEKAEKMKVPHAPEDKSISTLFVGGID